MKRGGKVKEDSIYKYNAPDIPYNVVKKPWSVALRGKKLFIYFKEEDLPRYIFIKHDRMWEGHGHRALSIKNVMDWVYQQF